MFPLVRLDNPTSLLYFIPTPSEAPPVGWSDVIWIEGPQGNVEHIAEHGITTDEVEDVLDNPDEIGASSSSGRPIAFGYARSSRYIAVVYEQIDDITVYPITAYEVTP